LHVLQPQFVEQVLEMGRQTDWFGSQVPPQPLADSLADRRTGRTVDLLGSVDVSVGHYGFRFAFSSIGWHRVKSGRIQLFPILSITRLSSKH
jgi:hypothetical protein